jgi:hypothetical protein
MASCTGRRDARDRCEAEGSTTERSPTRPKLRPPQQSDPTDGHDDTAHGCHTGDVVELTPAAADHHDRNDDGSDSEK